MEKYKALYFALHLWVNRKVKLPVDFLTLAQNRTIGGKMVWHNIAEEFLNHLQNIAMVVENKTKLLQDGSRTLTGEASYFFRPLELDPHFVHAYTYAVMGLTRLVGGTQFLVAETERPVLAVTPIQQAVETLQPQMPISRQQLPICGTCKHWINTVLDDGKCGNPYNGNLLVSFDTIGCEFHELPRKGI